MITFLTSLTVLVAAYFLYGTWVERKFGADSKRTTPAISINDGVDFVPLKKGKIFLIQFLNIAGLGPIFGAVAGAMWGPVAFLWIVFGSIFAGAVHDYFSGMLSLRHNGISVPEITGKYLGTGMKNFMRFFVVVLLILVGVVFVKGPAAILNSLTGLNTTILVIVIFTYYLLATLIPIDKLIGKVYPIFGLTLLFMAIGIIVALWVKAIPIPELTFSNMHNMHPAPSKYPIFPFLFITIACGAISGFHSTQSPMMARCLPNEKQGKMVFFGAMIAEGIVALIWAAVSMAFFGGVRELGTAMAEHGNNAAWVVNKVCNSLLGKVGGIIAIIGVVAAPITSGDTAFRSARLTIADAFNIQQTKLPRRLLTSVPLFAIGIALTTINFGIIWRYFGWANQTLATIMLWTAVMYMYKQKRNYWFILLPALFMTMVVVSYLFIAPEGFQQSAFLSYNTGAIVTIFCLILFLNQIRKERNH